MNLPSQDVLDDIKKLITEVTGFQEIEENFTICERYCLSHVLHHSYPSVNRTSVKNVINGYVSRFHGHGYFRVSQELNSQVKSFLSNEKLFQKNPQYDIQWCLLSLVSSLSSNLTSVKHVPELLPIDEEENEIEDINWGEYLTSDLPEARLSSDSEALSEDDDKHGEYSGSEVKPLEPTKKFEAILDNRATLHDERECELRRERMKQFLLNRRSKSDLENDSMVWGNISERFENIMNKEGVHRKSQYISEYELMENILYQFQTGERLLLRKGYVSPALTSLTQDTLADYLDSLQPYFKVIRSFRDFEADVTQGRYPEKEFYCLNESQASSSTSGLISKRRKRRVPNVLYVYSVMVRKALEPFQMKVIEIVENLNSYTLLKMGRELEAFFFDLTSLYRVHVLATRNWKKEPNWMSSIRVLSVLYNAAMEATTSRLSFMYMNLFLHCFCVYLDLIDIWISHLDLMDPHDEFIVTRLGDDRKFENRCSEYVIRPYKEEMKKSGVKNVAILDFIAEKMVHVGHSLEILKRLNRFVGTGMRSSSSFESLIERIKEQTNAFGHIRLKATGRSREKQRSIFTVKIVNVTPVGEEINGGGDTVNTVKEEKKEERKKVVEVQTIVEEGTACCTEFIRSTIHNPYLKMAFEEVGMKAVEKSLKEARKCEGGSGSNLMLVEKLEEEGSAIYPFHKIISESCYRILGTRLSDVCELVKDIVLREHNLEGWLSLLRSVLLFNDSYLIQPFILGFYTQPFIRQNSYSLTLNLRECAEVRYKDFASALSVTVVKDISHQTGEDVLKAIDTITVNYEVKWPLTLIFAPEVMEKYNEIFRIALKLKWAHWTLSGLGFKDVESKGKIKISKSSRHRMELLRFWFLSALARINNYFMTSMIPPDVNMKNCKDLKDIIRAHSDFLDRVHYNCLLGGKSPEGRKLIFQNLIPMCKEFEEFWREGNVVTESKLSTMESTFGNCHLFLTRLMSLLEKD